MKKRNVKNITVFVILIFSIITIFSACGKKEKEMVLSDNVMQQVKAEEKNDIKFIKAKKLTYDNTSYMPICWKDDENFIVRKLDNQEHAIDKVYKEDIDFYNINIKTSKPSKILTLKNVFCGDIGKSKWRGMLCYIKDNKLWVYDFIHGKTKEVYDLSTILEELRWYPDNKAMSDDELLNKVHAGFVTGSDRYIYIMEAPTSSNTTLRVLNFKTGKVAKSSNFLGYFPGADKSYYSFLWVYSKVTDAFYISSTTYNSMREFKLSNTEGLNNIQTVGGLLCDISEDGKEIYISTNDAAKGSRCIVRYSIEKDKSVNILSDRIKVSSGTENGNYIDVNLNMNLISYTAPIYTIDSSKNVTKMQMTSFIGNFDGKTIKNTRILPLEQTAKGFNVPKVIISPKSNRAMNSVIYFSYSKDNKNIKANKITNYIYEFKK